MADPTPPERKAASSNEALATDPPAKAGPGLVPSKMDGAAFKRTAQDAAGQQNDGDAAERFANTKLNIALISDPGKGPRFTLTKREAGLPDEEGGDMKTKAEASPKHAANHGNLAAEIAAPPPETPASEASTHAGSRAVENGSNLAAAGTTAEPNPRSPATSALPHQGVPPAAIAPEKVPIDSAKTFVGLNGTYYDENWRWMDWRGTGRSWNWPAALSLGQWFAYRRLYACAGLYLLCLSCLAAAIVNDVPIIAVLVLTVVLVSFTGIYGNRLYFLSFRRAVDHITNKSDGSYRERQSQLAASGGTSILSAATMGLLSIAGIIGSLYATLQLRGAFSFNFWPLF